jgi:hypothetical protein
MRVQAGMTIAVLIAAMGLQTESSAQWREGSRPGMFGERELGKPLKPRESRFGSGLARGPSGNFLGRTTADRGTTFQPRSRQEPEPQFPLPPEAYNLEPEQVPGYLEDQARRMAAVYQQQQRQLQDLYARQRPQPPVQTTVPQVVPPRPEGYQPPAVPTRPERYQPPAWPAQPGFPQPQPSVPGPTRQELQNSPDRWFRGAPTPTQPTQQQVPRTGLGSAGTLGPTGVAGRAGLNRSNPATLGARISQTLGARATGPISATVQGDTVTLQGSVATAADRVLAERMAAMEPGVRRIDNRLKVEAVPAGR